MNATINGINLYYSDVGPRDAETILFLHGFPFDHTMWDQQLIFFPSRFRCLAPDLRGHGQSRFNDARSIDQMADDAIALLDHANVAQATVVGLSMGGYIAFSMWRKAASRFKRLVLADTKAPPDTPEARANRAKFADSVLAGGSAVAADALMPRLFAPQNANSWAAKKIRTVIENTSAKSIAATAIAIGDRADSVPTLATIHAPTLILVGVADALTPVADSQAMKQGIPHSTLEIIQEAGHLSPMESPPDFNLALDKFVSGK